MEILRLLFRGVVLLLGLMLTLSGLYCGALGLFSKPYVTIGVIGLVGAGIGYLLIRFALRPRRTDENA
ncbi:MAG: hypothetical protein LWW81_16155 [Rhodocyclales bacterium]|nr:hypothetical protein [Rhodocyclales bacterium]